MCEVGKRCNGYLARAAQQKYSDAKTAREAAASAATSSGDRAALDRADREFQTARYALMDARVEWAAESKKGEASLRTQRDDLCARAEQEKTATGSVTRDTADELDDLNGAIEVGNRSRREKTLVSTGMHPSQVEELPDDTLNDRLTQAGITDP